MAVLVIATFLTTMMLFKYPVDALAVTLPRPVAAAVAAVLVGGAFVLVGKVALRWPLSNPHWPLAFAWIGLMCVATHCTLEVARGIGLRPANDNVLHILALFGLFFLFGMLANLIVRVTFGGPACNALQRYVTKTYSTFGKD
jgi:hypothetical protein